MRIKIIIINLVTLIFVSWSVYFIDTTHALDSLLNKKQEAFISQNIATSTIQKVLQKVTLRPVATENQGQVLNPGPLEIKDLQDIGNANAGAVTVEGIIERTNYERSQNSLAGLSESAELDVSAQTKANDILARQYFEHTSPDGKNVSDLVTATGYSYVRVGENLALGNFSDSLDVVTAWMNSPGHRANILDKSYEDIGIGVAYGNYQGHQVVVAVQHFGRPRSSCPDVDEQIKDNAQDLQGQINDLSSSLDILKNNIDTMRKNGQYVDNTIIDAYNNAVSQYETMVAKSNDLRDTYNQQVKEFNDCLAAL